MAYIGRTPQVGNYFTLDAITTSATATFNLLKGGVAYVPESAYHIFVSLNGVIQAPITAYTVSGSTIIFASPLASTDVINFITVLGDTLAIGTPSDGTVTDAKITAMAASKLTGTINNARISLDAAEIPNLDTAKVTTGAFADARIPNLNASKITTGTVATARLGSGTADGTTFLRGDQTYAAAGGGAWNFISSTSMVGTTILVTGLDSTYDVYMFALTDIHNDTEHASNTINAKAQQGGAIISASYNWMATQSTSAGSAIGTLFSGGGFTGGFRLVDNGIGSATAEVSDGVLYIYHPASTTHLGAQWKFTHYNQHSRYQCLIGNGGMTTTAATTGIQFSCNNGDFDGGTVRLYG